MPRCQHEEHNNTSFPYKLPNKTTVNHRGVVGFNPIHKRWEICDKGFAKEKEKNARASESRRFGDWENQDLTSEEVVEQRRGSPGAPDKASEKARENAGGETKRFLRRAEQRKTGIPNPRKPEPPKVK